MDLNEEILSFLGLGASAPAPTPRSPGQEQTAGRIGIKNGFELWLISGESAEWIELRGVVSVLRATRPKATLLLRLRETLRVWAERGVAMGECADIRLRVVGRGSNAKLYVLHRAWKPIKLCRRQASALLSFQQEVQTFIGQ